jgi:hypothetical protein
VLPDSPGECRDRERCDQHEGERRTGPPHGQQRPFPPVHLTKMPGRSASPESHLPQPWVTPNGKHRACCSRPFARVAPLQPRFVCQSAKGVAGSRGLVFDRRCAAPCCLRFLREPVGTLRHPPQEQMTAQPSPPPIGAQIGRDSECRIRNLCMGVMFSAARSDPATRTSTLC